MAERTLQVSVVTPERTVFEGEADMVVAPAWDGEIGILRGHAPMMALLGAGRMRIVRGGEETRMEVAGGFVQVDHDVVTILSEEADTSAS